MSNAQVVHQRTRSKREQREIDEDLLSEDVKCTQKPDCYCVNCAQVHLDNANDISQTIMFSNPDNSMDRFVPCRMKENLQAKFEAAS
jgi:hypothetical protein